MYIQLWDCKTRCDLKLPLRLDCHKRLCHWLLQVTNMTSTAYGSHMNMLLSSFGHEIGHNFGADHNRESNTVAPYEDAYGHWIHLP